MAATTEAVSTGTTTTACSDNAMNVWYAIPSKKSPSEAEKVLSLWRDRGYRIAVFRDLRDEPIASDLIAYGDYPGYSAAVNLLCLDIIAKDPDAEWIVTGGDDIQPDLNHTAGQIAFECGRHFGEKHKQFRMEYVVLSEHFPPVVQPSARNYWSTFGVMQPTGDRWGEQPTLPPGHPHRGAYIDRVCGSPWMGREFCQRMYGGRGPFFPGYRHMFNDEEMQAVVTKLGCFWQRPDLTHFHDHWGRKTGGKPPDYMVAANSPEHWERTKALFENRKALGFPGHEPLPVEAFA